MNQMMFAWVALVAVFVLAGAAQSASLFGDRVPGAARGSLIEIATPDDSKEMRASLFADRAGGSMFEPIIREPLAVPHPSGPGARMMRPGVDGLFDLIASAEAGSAGYNAVVWNARIKPPKPPTQMTIGEIYQWIRATPGQNHAIGRYQFIPSTLRRVVDIVGYPPSTRFTPQVQDRLGHVLLEDAGLSKFKSGRLSKVGFMNNLAKIWAGLPNSTGRSHYHGFAGNKATLSWPKFKAEMARIFPG